MHCAICLIVTGTGEREFLPKLFASLMARANCSFKVLRCIGQRDAVTSVARQFRMVGSGQTIPTKDEQEIGLPTRRWLRDHPDRYVVLVDDIERLRRPHLPLVFARYRKALDTLLSREERYRVSVHFFANMLEAYYFANSAAVNQVFGRTVIARDHDGDVEEIPHPKNDLKALVAKYDERRHGASIVSLLSLDHILSNPCTCGFLRSLMGWLVETALKEAEVVDAELPNRYCLRRGRREALTRNQPPCD